MTFSFHVSLGSSWLGLFLILTLFFDEHLFFNTCLLISTHLPGPEPDNKSMPLKGLVFRRELIVYFLNLILRKNVL